jgi:hypothetical protein
MQLKIFRISVLLLLPFVVSAQNKLSVNGYISQMGTSVFMKDSSDITWDYRFHNRINIAYYATDNITAHLQFRNQFLWGETVESVPHYADNFSQDKGLFDMNWNWFTEKNTLFNTQIDRAYIEYTAGNFELSAGRQRINWGRTFVWNPNDIFNAYSYYDFDYVEKPGADAVRATYYTGTASSAELVVKSDSSQKVTIAALQKFNKWGYDIQFIEGYANGTDFVAGSGCEGNIKSLGIRGEFSYWHPKDNFTDTTGVFLMSLALDYTFANNLMIQTEFLYNDKKTLIKSLTEFYRAPATSKSLSISEYNFFANVNYPVTPILSIYAAAMYYTDQKGYFLMPGIDLSVSENLQLSVIYQYFNVKTPFNTRMAMNMGFLRLKWNF